MNGALRLAALAAAGSLTIASVAAQSVDGVPQQTFRSAVDLVPIQASVRDGRGRVVQGLTPSDFEVRDNGEVRPVLSLRADRQSPISLAVLVDMSGSMRVGPKVSMARQAYESLLGQLHADDELAVFTFDSALHERQGFTSDLASVKNVLDDFDPFGTTSLYDAMAATARKLADRSATHKAIVVLTDGIDTSSTMTATEVSGLASSIDVPVFVVATVPMLDERTMLEATARGSRSDAADLRDLAEWTGGHLTFASSFAETTMVAARLVDDLRLQYILAIEAANVREWRRLDVRVKARSTTVKARSGYFGG